MNRHSDVTVRDEDRGTLLPRGRGNALKKGIQNKGRQISDEKDRSFEDQSSFEWGIEEEEASKKETKSKTKRQVSFDIDDQKKDERETSKSPNVGFRYYKDDTCVSYMQPSKTKHQPQARPTPHQYPGYEHSTNGSAQPHHTHRGHITTYTQSPTCCYGNPPSTNTLGNTVCYHNSDRSPSALGPAANQHTTNNRTPSMLYNDKQCQPTWSVQRQGDTCTEGTQQAQQLQFHYAQSRGRSRLGVQCQPNQPTMDNSVQVTVKGSSSTAIPPVSDSSNLLSGNLLTCPPDYGSCTLTPDYSCDNFQETFMNHVSPTTERKVDRCKDSEQQQFGKVSSESVQDVQGADWPYLVPQFDDLYSSDYDLSAHYKPNRLSSPEGQEKVCDKDSDDVSLHLDYSQLYNAGYYQLTYCDSDTQKEKLNQSSNVPEEHNAHIYRIEGCSKNNNACIQGQTAEMAKGVQSNNAVGEGQYRQVSVDSNKSMVSDYDAHDDTTELLPKIGQKPKASTMSNKQEWKNNTRKSVANDSVPDQTDSAMKKPTLLTSKHCGIRFHSLEIKPEDIVEANKKNILYASNLGEKVEEIWLCDLIKTPEDKVQSDKEETCEGSSDVLDDPECIENKEVRDIDFWDYDNSSSNSNYLGHLDTNHQSLKLYNQSEEEKALKGDTEMRCSQQSYIGRQHNVCDASNSVVEEYRKQSQPYSSSAVQDLSDNKQGNPEQGLQCLLLGDPGPIRSSSKKSSSWAATTEFSPKEEVNNSVEVEVEIHPRCKNYVTEKTRIEEKQDREKGEKEGNHTKLEKTDGVGVILGKVAHILNGRETTGVGGCCEIGTSGVVVSSSGGGQAVIESQKEKEGGVTENPDEKEDPDTKEVPPGEQVAKHLVKQASDASRSSGNTSGVSTAGAATAAKGKQPKQLQKVVYYQNRFITVPIDPRSCKARSISREKLRSSNGSVESKKSSAVNQTAAVVVEEDCSVVVVNGGKSNKCSKLDGEGSGGRRTKGKKQQEPKLNACSSSATVSSCGEGATTKGQPNGDMNPIELENSIISMHSVTEDKGEAVDGRPDKRSGTFSKADAVFNKIKEILQDKRCDDELAQKSQSSLSKRHSTSPVLKKVLNIIFIAIGVILLLGVVIVIIYTTIGRPGSRPGDKEYNSAHAQSNNQPNKKSHAKLPENAVMLDQGPGKTVINTKNHDVIEEYPSSETDDVNVDIDMKATTADNSYGGYEHYEHDDQFLFRNN